MENMDFFLLITNYLSALYTKLMALIRENNVPNKIVMYTDILF